MSACQEGEAKVKSALDRALKEKFEREQTMGVIEMILKEIEDKLNNKEYDYKVWKELQPEVNRMTGEQLQQMSKHYLVKISGFERELLSWSRKIFTEMAEESFKGKIENRNDASAFFRALIYVFHQPNFFDILVAAHS